MPKDYYFNVLDPFQDTVLGIVRELETDWELIRWIDAPNIAHFISELHGLGEKLLLLK